MTTPSDQLQTILEPIRVGALAPPLPDAHLVPVLIAAAGDAAGWRYIDFFTATSAIRTPAGPMLGRARPSSPGATAAA